jgi:hypothetical protein
MERAALRNGFLFATGMLALVMGVIHCSSSHPPLAKLAGDEQQGAGGSCYKLPTDGGCTMPIYYKALPDDVPINQNDLPDHPPDGGPGDMFCIGGPVGAAICPESQQRTFTCIAPNVFQITDTPGCKWPDGGDVGGPLDAATDADATTGTTDDAGESDAGTD